MNNTFYPAPELQTQAWLNTSEPLTLHSLRGRVVVIHAFQMLCPGCVSHSLPQAKLIRSAFPENDVAVIGLHTVFEHHAVMTTEALKVFVHEYGINYPVAIDQPDTLSDIPLTMQTYALHGTPSLIIIDRKGYMRLNHFGQLDDLRLGAIIGQLLTESDRTAEQDLDATKNTAKSAATCDDDSCSQPE